MTVDAAGANAAYIDQLYAQYQRDPSALDQYWTAFFKGFELGYQRSETDDTAAVLEDASTSGPGQDAYDMAQRITDFGVLLELRQSVYSVVGAYRQFGHLIARLDPLGHSARSHPLLALAEFGLSEDDLDKPLGGGGFLGQTDGTLRHLIEQLHATYAGTLGVECESIADKDQRTWLQQRMEPSLNEPALSDSRKRQILERLMAAQEFERFLHTRHVGKKRFSIEGGEALVPLLDTLIEIGSAQGLEEMVIGMAHRGRLNVLAHLLRKPYQVILGEFEGTAREGHSAEEGDVKYHLGYSYDHISARGRKIHLSLSFNPSHLELVDPVIEGIVHAKQDYLHDTERCRVMPVLIHGDAAFTGQGTVAETLNLSQLEGYRTGGSIHIVINNQLGYTATPQETRFTPYPTDVAQQIQAPVFHVNADDPEAVVHAAELAIGFRHEFKVDVLIDLWCYRRHGHSEGDDPALTQPLMYREIARHPTVVDQYAEKLVGEGVVEAGEIKAMHRHIRSQLDKAQEMVEQALPLPPPVPAFGGVWKGLAPAGDDWDAETAVDADRLTRLGQVATKVPEGFALSRTVQRIMTARREMAEGSQPVDWGCAEMLALASLLQEHIPVRLVGQDSQRGTFAHRHAVWHDVRSGQRHVPLAHVDEEQGAFVVLNTMLSELAVLGFEYGISCADPRRLVMWEAQFGDFVNGAQLIIDQFISAGETKWQRMSGLVLLLPHGYEGMGPDHSSARPERFLQLCAKNNMQVCYPTTPAQYFHLLRRQMQRRFRKPLILMMPKSLLRNRQAVSDLAAFTQDGFQCVVDDPEVGDVQSVRRLVLCSGKVYYDLAAGRGVENEIALVRLEQLYPFPRDQIRTVLERYTGIEEVLWVQEEPRNMGAWTFVECRLDVLLDGVPLRYVGRDEAASPATGFYRVHQAEQEEIVSLAASFDKISPAEESENGERGTNT